MVPTIHQFSSRQTGKRNSRTLRLSRIQRWLGLELSRALALLLSAAVWLSGLSFYGGTIAAAPQTISLQATAQTGTQIRLSWSIRNPGSISSINIYRTVGQGNVNYQFLTSLAASSPLPVGFIDQNLSPGVWYNYKVRTAAPGGVLLSTESNAVSVQTPGTASTPTPTPTATPTPQPTATPTPRPSPTPTATPTPQPTATPTPRPSPTPTATPTPQPTATPTPRPSPTPQPTATPTPAACYDALCAAAISASQIVITWTPNSRVSTVRLYRADQSDPNNFVFLSTLNMNPAQFTDSGLRAGTTYFYYIKMPVPGGGILLSPPSNTAVATTFGGAPTPTPTPTPNVTPTPTPTPGATPTPRPSPTPTPSPSPTPGPTPAPSPTGGGPIPLDNEEAKLIQLITFHRETRFLGTLRPSIALSKSSDFLSRDLATRNTLSIYDSLGRDVQARARAFGYLPNTTHEAVVAAGNLTAEQVLNRWKSSYTENEIILNPNWKVAGVSHTYNASTGQWYWVAEFAAFWDKTIPVPGEDDDGMVDGNPLIRTRPPGWALAAGHRFNHYGDIENDWYQSVHCDLDDPTHYCWKDEPPQGNPSLSQPSNSSFIPGLWHVQYTISPTGIKHYNDYNGWDATGFTISLWINTNGTWASQGYRAYQVPTPTESGWWTSVHDMARDEEIITFYRQNGRSTATIRAHVIQGEMTWWAVGGSSAMGSFLTGFPADNNRADDPQIILHPGVSYFNAPHEPFPGSNSCPHCGGN